MKVEKYLATPDNLNELKSICLIWQGFGFWSFDEVISFLENKNHVLFYFANQTSEWTGAALFTTNSDESDLVYIFIRPDSQKSGLGYDFLKSCVMELGIAPGVRKIFLEVRTDNIGAISLYKKFGFILFGKRRGYYHDGSDALVMKWEQPND